LNVTDCKETVKRHKLWKIENEQVSLQPVIV